MERDTEPTPDAPDPEAFTDYTPEALPKPVPASSPRYPNRKPGYRRRYRQWETRQAKKVFLVTYRLCDDTKIASKRVALHPATISRWKKVDPAFNADFEDARSAWEFLYSAKMESLTSKSIDVVEDFLQPTELQKYEDPRAAFNAAKFVLETQGLAEPKVGNPW